MKLIKVLGAIVVNLLMIIAVVEVLHQFEAKANSWYTQEMALIDFTLTTIHPEVSWMMVQGSGVQDPKAYELDWFEKCEVIFTETDNTHAIQACDKLNERG